MLQAVRNLDTGKVLYFYACTPYEADNDPDLERRANDAPAGCAYTIDGRGKQWHANTFLGF